MADPGSGTLLGRGYQGAVFLVGDGAELRVVKRPIGRGLARAIGRRMLDREWQAYQRLRGLPGVPLCLGREADGSLVLEYVHGEVFRETASALVDRERFCAVLLERILALHAAGVAHADLKRRGNILIGADGLPIVLDFGTAVLRAPRPGPFNRALFAQAVRMDLNAWIKLKYRRNYDRIEPGDRAFYRPTALEGVARAIRQAWRRLTWRRWRKRRRLRRQSP